MSLPAEIMEQTTSPIVPKASYKPTGEGRSGGNGATAIDIAEVCCLSAITAGALPSQVTRTSPPTLALPRKRGGNYTVGASRHLVAATIAATMMLSTAHAAPPQRIVSLNVCTDQILVDLVAPARIAGVTHLAMDATISAAPQNFANLSATRGDAEDVLARDPDLVIAGGYTTPATVDLLRRLGRSVLVVPLPQDIAGVRAVIAQIAVAVDDVAVGAAVIADFDARIERARARVAGLEPHPIALVYQVNNYVAGTGTLVDEALHVAGFRNGGAAVRTLVSGQTSLEAIVTAPPDLLVLASRPDAYATSVGDNLRHPALKALLTRLPSLVLPWPLWLCGTQHIATAIERLADARLSLQVPQKYSPRPQTP